MADDLHGDKDKDRFIRVQLSSDSAVPVFGKAGLINLLTQSDGLVRIPCRVPGVQQRRYGRGYDLVRGPEYIR